MERQEEERVQECWTALHIKIQKASPRKTTTKRGKCNNVLTASLVEYTPR